MFSRTDDLVGRRCVASVSEPWDFSSRAGQNALVGQVVAVSEVDAAVQWAICEVSPFDVGSETITQVAVTRRYASDSSLLEQLLGSENVGVNFAYDRTGRKLTARSLLRGLATDSLHFLVGSIRVNSEQL